MPIRFHVHRDCLLAFKRFTSSEKDRPMLHGIRCEVGKEAVVLAATDGRKLLALRIDAAPGVETEVGDFTIPTILLEKLPDLVRDDDFILRSLPPMKPEQYCRGLTVEAEGDRVSIIGEWTVAATAPSPDYPNWRGVLAAKPAASANPEPIQSGAAPRFGAEHVSAFCEAAGRLYVSSVIEIHQRGELEGALVFFPHAPHAIGMMMPMKKAEGEPELKVPDWAQNREGFDFRKPRRAAEKKRPSPRAGAKSPKGKKATRRRTR